MWTWVLAIGRPIVIGSPAATIGDTVDQIVVSVGPYMLSSWPRSRRPDAVDERRRQRLAAEQQLLSEPSAAEPGRVGGDHGGHRRRALQVGDARGAGSGRRAIGRHSSSSASSTERHGRRRPVDAGLRPAQLVEVREASSTVSSSTPKSIRQAISSTPQPRSRSTWRGSSRACRTARPCRRSARRRGP